MQDKNHLFIACLFNSSSFQHKGWFEVLSWNWGMTSNRKTSQLSESDKTSINELSIVKFIGIDSPAIRMLFTRGSVIPKIDFSIRPEALKRQAQSKYVDIKLENIQIKSIVTGGGIEDKFFKEYITLLFERVRFEYSKSSTQGADGSDYTAVEDYGFGWNVADSSEWKTV